MILGLFYIEINGTWDYVKFLWSVAIDLAVMEYLEQLERAV